MVYLLLSIAIVSPSFATSHTKTKTPQTEYVLICVSPTAHSYHIGQCRGLQKCTHEIKKVTLSEAQQMGRKPCGFCYR